jgi:hypothetical protein
MDAHDSDWEGVANVFQDDGIELAILLEEAASRSRTLRHVNDASLLDLHILHGGVMNVPERWARYMMSEFANCFACMSAQNVDVPNLLHLKRRARGARKSNPFGKP